MWNITHTVECGAGLVCPLAVVSVDLQPPSSAPNEGATDCTAEPTVQRCVHRIPFKKSFVEGHLGHFQIFDCYKLQFKILLVS